MCKTSVKKNLYWSIKDKVIEESFNGVRSIKRSAKVKIYGTDSNREVRARLIEILYDRVRYHKDKFVAPIIHAEMQAMETKKNGKVEHSTNSHDDQVFSYLMALYVWYDGENLAEKFHIMKNTIKTDEDEEIVESPYEDQIEKKAQIDTTMLEQDPDSELAQALKFVEENSGIVTSRQLREDTYIKEIELRNTILSTNKDARESYCKQTGLDESMFKTNSNNSLFIELPDQLFTDEDYDPFEQTPKNNLAGNLADWWNKV